MDDTIYRINKAGAYAVGHFDSIGLKIALGRPLTCRMLDLTCKQAMKLLNCLDIDFEDGAWLSDALEGQVVLVTDDEEGHAIYIGDPFDTKCVDLEEER